jgi:hypothetical protein
MLVIVMVTTLATTVSVALEDVSEGSNSTNSLARVQWQVADQLRRDGLRQGDEVAFIGDSFTAYWARLARLRIVAEILPEEAYKFWAADALAKERVINAFRDTNAKIVVTDHIPVFRSTSEWRRIGHTDYYVFPLQAQSLSEQQESTPSLSLPTKGELISASRQK